MNVRPSTCSPRYLSHTSWSTTGSIASIFFLFENNELKNDTCMAPKWWQWWFSSVSLLASLEAASNKERILYRADQGSWMIGVVEIFVCLVHLHSPHWVWGKSESDSKSCQPHRVSRNWISSPSVERKTESCCSWVNFYFQRKSDLDHPVFELEAKYDIHTNHSTALHKEVKEHKVSTKYWTILSSNEAVLQTC